MRRQGLEPRTRGLRVRCSVRLFSLNCYQTMLACAGSCQFVRSPASGPRCGYRMLPARTGASERANIGVHRSRPPWSRVSGRSAANRFGDQREWYRSLALRSRASRDRGRVTAADTVRDPRCWCPPPEPARVGFKECSVHTGCCRPPGGEEQAPAISSTAKAKTDAGLGECAVVAGCGLLLAILERGEAPCGCGEAGEQVAAHAGRSSLSLLFNPC